jgi:putative toxin-antitoxin system antitoxin component (TIGR02293 family)
MSTPLFYSNIKDGAATGGVEPSSVASEHSPKTKKQLMEFALKIFGNDKRDVRSWLSTSNSALNNAAPIDLLGTPEGIEEVYDILGRIAYGVYS